MEPTGARSWSGSHRKATNCASVCALSSRPPTNAVFSRFLPRPNASASSISSSVSLKLTRSMPDRAPDAANATQADWLPTRSEDAMRAIHRSACAFAITLLGTLALWSSPAIAEPWPQRTVRVILPLPAGGATDAAARLFAQGLSARWGQPVIVENRLGGDGIPAVTGFLAARDNHTLILSFAGLITINPLVHDKLPYDPARDLVPIASMVDNFFAIAVSETLKIGSLEDFVMLARAQPGKLNWAATSGLPDYIFAALQKSAGLKLTQVSYRDFVPALHDLGEGRIHVAVTGLSLLLPQVQSGKAKVLMVTNHERSPLAPDVPTAKEAGYPDLTFSGVVGFYGWRDIPAELRERIAADVRAVGSDPAIGARIASLGSVVRVGTPAEFAAAIEEQRVKIAAIHQTIIKQTQ
ncbi:MAG: tripartite tricarboxylate transporter substrate binding protein [Alphaproteobacteria bacterium]|nr:MAG: tripartite tricarboxylate transporter substrate binding protein [Alphaproteobacteria bacterium]